jgi:hypothetical protein
MSGEQPQQQGTATAAAAVVATISEAGAATPRPATGGGTTGSPPPPLSRANSKLHSMQQHASNAGNTSGSRAPAGTSSNVAVAVADNSDAAIAAELNKALSQARAEGCSQADLQYIELQIMHNRCSRCFRSFVVEKRFGTGARCCLSTKVVDLVLRYRPSTFPSRSIIKKRHDYLVQCLSKARNGEQLEEVPPKFDVVNTEIFKNVPVRDPLHLCGWTRGLIVMFCPIVLRPDPDDDTSFLLALPCTIAGERVRDAKRRNQPRRLPPPPCAAPLLPAPCRATLHGEPSLPNVQIAHLRPRHSALHLPVAGLHRSCLACLSYL